MVDFIIHKDVSPAFKSHMDNVMEQLPPETASYLHAKGWEFHLVCNAPRDFADIDQSDTPTSRAMGSALEDGGLKHIYFFQRGRDPLTNEIFEDSWATPEIAVHEMGHALNGEIGYQTGVKLSDQENFKAAHTRDVGRMLEAEVDQNVYFIQTPHARDPYARGRSETVAEMLTHQLVSRRSTIGDTIKAVGVFDIEVQSFGDKFPDCAALCWENVTQPILRGEPIAQKSAPSIDGKATSVQGQFSQAVDGGSPQSSNISRTASVQKQQSTLSS